MMPATARSSSSHHGRWSEAVFVLLAFLLAQSLVLAMTDYFPGKDRLLVATNASVLCACIAAMAAAAWMDRLNGGRYLGAKRISLPALMACTASGVATSLAVWLLVKAFPADGTAPPMTLRFLEGGPEILAWWVVGTLVLAPIGEEVVFRGAIQSHLAPRVGVAGAIVIGALCFLLPHLPQLDGYWPAAVAIFALGCVAGVARVRTGSICGSMVVHASYNAVVMAFVLGTRF